MNNEIETNRIKGRKLGAIIILIIGCVCLIHNALFIFVFNAFNNQNVFLCFILSIYFIFSLALIIVGLILFKQAKKSLSSDVDYISKNLSDMDSDQFYNSYIKKYEEKYNKLNTNPKKAFIVVGGITSILGVIVGIAYNYTFIIFISIIIFAITLFLGFVKTLFWRTKKQSLIVDILKKSLDYIGINIKFTYFKTVEVYLHKEIPDDYSNIINDSGIFKNMILDKNFRHIIYDNCFFLTVYEVYTTVHTYDNDKNYVNFGGSFLKTSFHKKTDKIIILPIESNFNQQIYNVDSMPKIELLIDGYIIFASNIHDVTELITPKFIENFLSLVKYYNTKIALSLYNGNIYIAFEQLIYYNIKRNIKEKDISKGNVFEMINEIKKLIDIDKEFFSEH